MLLFVAISGYLYHHSSHSSWKNLLRTRLQTLGIPLLVFTIPSCINTIIAALQDGQFSIAVFVYAKRVLHSYAMWFLLALLINNFALTLCLRLFRTKATRYLSMLILTIGFMFIPDGLVMAVHKFTFPFFALGYISAEESWKFPKISRHRWLWRFTLLASAIAAISLFKKHTYIYTSGLYLLNSNTQWLIDIQRLIIAAVVSLAFLEFLRPLASTQHNKIVLHISKNTLLFYGFNIVFNQVYSHLVTHFHLPTSGNFLPLFVYLACFFTLTIPTIAIINRCPPLRFLFTGR